MIRLRWPWRSVTLRILLWSVSALLIALFAFNWVTSYVAGRAYGSIFRNINAYQMHSAIVALERGGQPELDAYLRELHTFLRAEYYLTDAAGRDLVDGTDRSAWIGGTHAPRETYVALPPRAAVSTLSADGRHRFVIVFLPLLTFAAFVPYYLLVLAVVTVLFWLLAIDIASPVRRLATVMERFGRGELDARVNTRRRDEIGDLGRRFDEMAERIQTLLTAERLLLQDVSHELQSPLARLNFAAELVRSAPDPDAAVARLRGEIDRLSALVGALLQMTRAEGDPTAVSFERVCVGDLVHDVVERCRIEAEEQRSRILLRTATEVWISGEGELLERAFENVLRNAIRIAPADSLVEVNVDQGESEVLIRVRDRGPGVPNEALAKIFSPFYRVDASRNEQTGGVGLGLAIAQRAVRLHHGRIEAENAEPGLRVTLRLPALKRN